MTAPLPGWINIFACSVCGAPARVIYPGHDAEIAPGGIMLTRPIPTTGLCLRHAQPYWLQIPREKPRRARNRP